jgi:hypothetical protein
MEVEGTNYWEERHMTAQEGINNKPPGRVGEDERTAVPRTAPSLLDC